MTVFASDIAQVLENWAPVSLAENYDNVGLLVGSPDQEVSGVLINLDMTEEVIMEARAKGFNMVIAHHPIWFSSRKRLNGEDYVSRAIISAIKNDILLYAFHTNLDNVRSGVNAKIAEKLGLKNIKILAPKPFQEGEIGSGMIGNLPEELSKESFLSLVKEQFHCGGIRYADSAHEKIQRVAVCGGAGSFLTKTAIQEKADAFVTADITYHKFFDNEGQLLLLDIGHYESEQFTSELIQSFLSEKFANFAVRLSEVHTNPVRYF